MRAELPQALLLVVGAGWQRATLEARAGAGVRFVGLVHDPLPYLQTADTFVLPSDTEGLPNALLEAMAVGLPCVATTIGGTSDALRDGQEGWLVPPGQSAPLASALRDGLAGPDRWQRGRAARERVIERYDLELTADRLVALLSRTARHSTTTSVAGRQPMSATSPRRTAPPPNVLSVDLEDYYQVEGFADLIPRESWPRWAPRLELGSQRLLELFARTDQRATFFTLGYVAERHPALVREIAAAGHEIASHGYDHRLVYRQTPAEFRADLRRARGLLEDLLGVAVTGYRAPCYSITADTLWALDLLAEEGFVYDSSVFPVHHDRYGLPGAPRFPHLLRRPAGPLVELPPSTIALGPLNLPLAGGGYFRLLPYALFRAACTDQPAGAPISDLHGASLGA